MIMSPNYVQEESNTSWKTVPSQGDRVWPKNPKSALLEILQERYH